MKYTECLRPNNQGRLDRCVESWKNFWNTTGMYRRLKVWPLNITAGANWANKHSFINSEAQSIYLCSVCIIRFTYSGKQHTRVTEFVCRRADIRIVCTFHSIKHIIKQWRVQSSWVAFVFLSSSHRYSCIVLSCVNIFLIPATTSY